MIAKFYNQFFKKGFKWIQGRLKSNVCITILVCIFPIFIPNNILAQNPIVKNKGLCDPQVRVYGDKVYLYATHDASPGTKDFIMHDWWIWSTNDLVNWKYESTLRPEDTYYRKPSNTCWATDAMTRNGKYYMYFSMGVTDVGVVVSDSPTGPWKDPLGKPLLPANLTPVEERDPGIIMDDDGNAYIVFGVWDFYIARLNEDMISLAETPRKIILDHKMGPYGEGKTDDKPFLHKRDGKYYLSWGCYYAMSDNVYGPYNYKGSVIIKERVAPEFQKALTFDRHGSFFELYNQWYYICNDQSLPGSGEYFRNSVLSYIHYKDNGEIEPVYLNSLGVARYDASIVPIEAENYFKAFDTKKNECPEGGYEIRGIHKGSYLVYPKVMNLKQNSSLSFRVSSDNPSGGTIEIRENGIEGKLLGTCQIPNTSGWTVYRTITCKLKNESVQKDIFLVFKGNGNELLRLNWLSFK
jgi:arabinoxylan arabinofuranohydrolase